MQARRLASIALLLGICFFDAGRFRPHLPCLLERPTTKLTHECRYQDSRIANPHSAALIAWSAWCAPDMGVN
jgi:hypothetical protein